MSYKSNLNQIDSELKKVFNTVNINTENQSNVEIDLSSSLLESVNDKLEMSIFINKFNLNQMSPTLEWGYYTDTNTKDNSILFNTSISEMVSSLEIILTKNRFSADYLNSLVEEEVINENIDVQDTDVSFEDIYEIKGTDLNINRHNLRVYFETKHGIILEDIILSHFDKETGQPKGSFINDDPTLGDDNELRLKNISSITLDGDISPAKWIEIEMELKNIPHVEDVYVNTNNYSILINISNEVFSELH